jgi:hypothetical protein
MLGAGLARCREPACRAGYTTAALARVSTLMAFKLLDSFEAVA